MTNSQLTSRDLGEAFEEACALAAKLYAQNEDTTDADAEVDRLHALLTTEDPS